jgi:hypothetical protein
MTAWRVSWCGVHAYDLPHKHQCKKSINKQINTTLSKWREVLWWESTLLPSHDVQRSNPILFIFLNVLTFMRFYVFKLSRGPRFDYGLSPFFWFIKFFIFINFFHPWHDYFLVVDRDESTQMLQSCGPDCDECNKSLLGQTVTKLIKRYDFRAWYPQQWIHDVLWKRHEKFVTD